MIRFGKPSLMKSQKYVFAYELKRNEDGTLLFSYFRIVLHLIITDCAYAIFLQRAMRAAFCDNLFFVILLFSWKLLDYDILCNVCSLIYE